MSACRPAARGSRGAIHYAVVPYAVAPPFRLRTADGSETGHPDAGDLGRAVVDRTLPVEFELVMRAKIRPVLLLHDRPLGRFKEFAALQITSIGNFDPARQEAIRRQEEPALFHLDPRRKPGYGLRKESVVEVNALVRVRHGALAGGCLGRVDQAEFRTICERLARVSDLDLADLIRREAGELVRARRQA
jgi:hypothetical protein